VTWWQKRTIFGILKTNPILMASIRQLKKDIDNQVFEIVSDCFTLSELHPENKSDEIGSIIEEAVSLRNDLIARINNPDGKDNPKIVRKYYQTIESDLESGVDKLCKQLSALSSKKKK
jgi:hypothetical protein